MTYDAIGNMLTRGAVKYTWTQGRMVGNLLVSERTGTEKNLWYRYDSAGNVISVTYDSTLYIYARNARTISSPWLTKRGMRW